MNKKQKRNGPNEYSDIRPLLRPEVPFNGNRQRREEIGAQRGTTESKKGKQALEKSKEGDESMKHPKKDCLFFGTDEECTALKSNECSHCKFYKNKFDKIAVDRRHDYEEWRKHKDSKEGTIKRKKP